jgi:hypothetical protein
MILSHSLVGLERMYSNLSLPPRGGRDRKGDIASRLGRASVAALRARNLGEPG